MFLFCEIASRQKKYLQTEARVPVPGVGNPNRQHMMVPTEPLAVAQDPGGMTAMGVAAAREMKRARSQAWIANFMIVSV